MFENLTIGHILVILVVVLLLFGAKRLPEIGQSMGKGIREFKKGLSQMESNARDAGSEPRYLPRESAEPSAGSVARDEETREPKRLI